MPNNKGKYLDSLDVGMDDSLHHFFIAYQLVNIIFAPILIWNEV